MKIAMVYRLVAAILFCCFAAALPATGDDAPAEPAGLRVQELQGKMMGDPGIMALITALQADPEVQALLADPKVLEAVLSGDFGALVDDARIRRLMNDPQVREIEKRLQSKDPGAGP